jgi:crossover junction endodeoxyribonuclease RuvC
MIIGIDPGNSGAVAFIGHGHEYHDVFDLPLMANGKKQQINPHELKRLLEVKMIAALAENKVDMLNGGERFHCYIEKVSAMPGQGVASMFNFGMGYGIIQGVVSALGIPYELVTPQSWKKRAGLIGKDKDNARTMAQQLYPDAPLGRKKDIGRADALLIARFGNRIGV